MSAVPASTKLSALSSLLTQLQGRSGYEDKREGMRDSEESEEREYEEREREDEKAWGTHQATGHSNNTPKVTPKAKDHEKIYEAALQEARDRHANRGAKHAQNKRYDHQEFHEPNTFHPIDTDESHKLPHIPE